jgi:group I intron endonuclease
MSATPQIFALERLPGIYAIRHEASGKVYVGSSQDVRTRCERHLRLLCRGVHFSKHLQAAWDAYGESGFTFGVLEAVPDIGNLIAREQSWLDRFCCYLPENGYNSCRIADRQTGIKQRPETRAKRSASMSGRIVSAETCARISAALTGKKLSAETRAKISLVQKGKARGPMLEATKGKLSAIRTGKKLSAEHCSKLSIAHIGNRHTPEQSMKISRALTGIVRSPETRARMSAAQRLRRAQALAA